MPDWEKLAPEEPGAVPAGTTTDEFSTGVGEAMTGVKKGIDRTLIGIDEGLHLPNFPPRLLDYQEYRKQAMEPGKSLAEKTGIGVGSVIPAAAGGWEAEPALASGLESLAAGKAPGIVKPLSEIASKAIGGGLGAELQPAESPDERASNARWGAGVSAGLAALGIGGKAAQKIPPGMKAGLEHAFERVLGGVLGGHYGHPFAGMYGARHSGIGKIVTEALPWILRQAAKVPGAAVGVGITEATEKQPPDWEKVPPSPPPPPAMAQDKPSERTWW